MDAAGGLSRRLEPREAFTFLCEQLTLSVGRVILLSGDIASGKTYVQSEFVQHAAESGILTLSAAGAPDEQDVGAGVLEALLSSPALPDEVTERVDAVVLEPDPDGPAVRELCRALLRLARERPMVVTVDDLQFADEVSLQLLLQVQRRIRSTRLVVVLGQSPTYGPVSARLSQFARAPHTPVRLAPLSVDTIGSLGGPDDPAKVHELSAGNPLLVGGLLDDGSVDGPGFGKAVGELLNRGHGRLRDVAGAIAVLDAPAEADRVARVASADADLAAALVASLTGAGLVVGGRFRHPALTTAVLAGLSPACRVDLHERSAAVKHEHGAPAAEVAAHLVAAGRLAGDWSVPVLTDAAESALRGGDLAFATACLELAASDDTQRRSLAGLIWRIDPANPSGYQSALRETCASGTVTDAVPVLRQALWLGEQKLADLAFDAVTEPDPRTDAELRLAYLWHFGTTKSLPVADGTDPWAHAADTLARLWTRGGSEACTASAERILQNCRLSDTSLEALATAITALAWDDKTERAEEWCTSLSEDARRRGARTWQAVIDAVWSGITLRRGDIAAAASLAKSTLELLPPRAWGVAISYPLTTLLTANTLSGAFRTAAEVLRHPVPDTVFDTVGGLFYLRARGYYHLATNRVLAAVSDFQQCRRLLREWDADLPALLPWRTDLAEANLRLGEPRAAAELARQQMELEIDPSAHGAALRILAFVGDPARRIGLLQNAAEQFKVAGNRLELGKTARALAQLRQRRGETVLTPEPKRERPPAKPAPKPVAKVESAEAAVLSESEMRVAQLAALGHTNRQIASTLFITMSTVEQHLTRVYRKLGVPGRSALPADLADDVAPELSAEVIR